MAKIDRATQKVFGDGVVATDNIAQFGSLKAGTPQFSKDPSVIQGLPAYDEGWKSGVVNNQAPALQDVNALDYLFSRQLAYLLQAGIPEYDSGTTYYQGSWCQSSGVLYVSKTDDNTGNALSNTTHWKVGLKPTASGEVFGHAPVGSIMAWQGGYFTSGSNGGFTNVLGNTVALANAYLNPYGYHVCDGAQVNDPDSPIFSAAGRYLPNLSDSRFLMGSTAAGAIGGENSNSHTHSVTSNVSVGNITLTAGQIPQLSTSYTPAGTNAAGTCSGSSAVGGTHTHRTSHVVGSNSSGFHTWTAMAVQGGSTYGLGYGDLNVSNADSGHSHSFSGTTSAQAFTGTAATITVGSASPSAIVHSVTNPAVTSGVPSDTENRPLYLSTFFIMRIK